MKTSDFYFDLPEDLIAQTPRHVRSSGRLLVVDPPTHRLEDDEFIHFPDLIEPNDLLVFNDAKVIPARLYGKKESGGKVEILIERMLENQTVLAHVKASKRPKVGSRIYLQGASFLTVIGNKDDLLILQFPDNPPLMELLEQIGHIPLPPYIHRNDDEVDQEAYQTIYARIPGAVAAPTAGLHFDQGVLERLKNKGVVQKHITLYVGAGTFQPVRVADPSQHKMHSEVIEVDASVCEAIADCKRKGGRVIAVGTTVVRALETAAQNGEIRPFTGDTKLFIRPGYTFKVVDALLTNFHLSGSTLLMLVSAFGGHSLTMEAYRHAVQEGYRFFSYGDAMFLRHRNEI